MRSEHRCRLSKCQTARAYEKASQKRFQNPVMSTGSGDFHEKAFMSKNTSTLFWLDGTALARREAVGNGVGAFLLTRSCVGRVIHT